MILLHRRVIYHEEYSEPLPLGAEARILFFIFLFFLFLFRHSPAAPSYFSSNEQGREFPISRFSNKNCCNASPSPRSRQLTKLPQKSCHVKPPPVCGPPNIASYIKVTELGMLSRFTACNLGKLPAGRPFQILPLSLSYPIISYRLGGGFGED